MMLRRPIISIALTLSFISVAFIFLWVVFHASPVSMGKYLAAQVGSAIGVTVSIPPNPFSMLAQQLAEKEKELQQKERALEAKTNEKQGSQNKMLAYIGALGGILLALILANFYFDYRRRNK